MSAFLRVAVFTLVAFAAAAESDYAIACRGWQFETMTLLNKLPPDAQNETIVARVEVIEALPAHPQLVGWWFTHLVKVRVVEPVKGVRAGQEFTVNTRGTSCDQNFTAKTTGQRGYIAGRMQLQEGGEWQFTGRWKTDLASGGLVRDSD